MGPCVEANSLSDITQIASNPPKYPRNPTETQRQPLTLYIARIPGSKDIILTTLKPQLKNVSAEDVESSLYFLHLNTEDDARLLAEEQKNTMTEELGSVSKLPLARKPLPETTRSLLDLDSLREPDNPVTGGELSPDHLRRKPLLDTARSPLNVSQSIQFHNLVPSSRQFPSSNNGKEFQRKEVPTGKLPAQSRDQSKEVAQQRPLGPRPLMSGSPVERKPIENQPLSPRPLFQDISTGSVSSASNRLDFLNHDGLKLHGSSKSFSFTIIRRDPSSGAQWNIGTVTGESHNQGMNTISNPKKPNFDISVYLITPGYTSFRDSQAISESEESPQSHKQQDALNNSGDATTGWGFKRQVRMEGSSIWDRTYKQHNRSQSSSSDTRAETRGSAFVLPSVSISNSTADNSDSSSKGYVFLSPWGGRCKFSTGGAGRSLRCKHTLPDSLSSSNAVFESSGSAIVSELRFNLPHSSIFHSPTAVNSAKGGGVETGRFSIPRFGHIRNKLSRGSRPSLPPRPHATSYDSMHPSGDEMPPPLPPRLEVDQFVADSSDDQELSPSPIRSHPFEHAMSLAEEENERLDLSIGQEKAGGGNRGKRAKLGKLIILDEGFKMLDLIVAANMGVWWSVFMGI